MEAQPIPSRRDRPTNAWIATAVLIGAVVIGAGLWWLLGDPAPSSPTGIRAYVGHGVEFGYPTTWTMNDTGWPTSGFGSVWAVIGTMPWGPCLPGDLNCHYQVRLEPGQIEVELGRGTLPGGDVCVMGRTRSDLEGRGPDDPQAFGSLMRVGGRPALVTDYAVGQRDYYRSDEWRRWVIAAPGSTGEYYSIDAKYRGPDVATFRRQLDDLVASLRFTEPAGPADCGMPFPPG